MKLIIFTGNIGCGKSTKASELAKEGYVIVNMDDIVSMIGGGDYTLYDDKKKNIYHHMELSTIASALSNGFSVVVDRTNMPIKTRKRFIEIGKAYNAEIISYDWGIGKKEDLNRRNKEHRGIEKKQWEGYLKNLKRRTLIENCTHKYIF